MKKFFYLIAILMIFNLTACKNFFNNDYDKNDKNKVSLDYYYDTNYVPTKFDTVKGLRSLRDNYELSDKYSDLSKLSSDLDVNFFGESIFDPDNDVALFIKDASISRIYLLPKDFDKDNSGEPILVSRDSIPNVVIEWISNKTQKPFSHEMLGNSSVDEIYDFNNMKIAIIKITLGENTYYSGICKANDMTYSLNYYKDKETLKSTIEKMLVNN